VPAGGDVRLEATTLTLINGVAYAASSSAHARRFEDATAVDLRTSEIRLLEHLSGRGQVPTGLVAATLDIDLGQASRQGAQLEELGLVARMRDPDDGRRTLMSLSPEGTLLMDNWLRAWSADCARPLATWSARDLRDLERWLALCHARLTAALPASPTSMARARYLTVVEPTGGPRALRTLVATVVDLVSWVGLSGGFNDLLAAHGAKVRQHGYFTLRIVARHGPLSVAEVAERMGVHPSQASKRLTRLTELGLVDREVDSADRRSQRLRVSATGAALETEVRNAQLADFASVLPPISTSVRARWTELMKRYVGELVRPSGSEEPSGIQRAG